MSLAAAPLTAPSAAPSLRPALLAWFDAHRRPLPWRQTRDPYAIWLSEVMLQQTQVSTVIPYWERFLLRFPTFEALAGAALPDVLGLWRGLGYYSRARSLHRAAAEVVSRFGGKLPEDPEALAELPTFGPYTVGAVASIAFGRCVPLVDGNVARVFSRLFEVEGAQGDRERERRLWALAAGLVEGPRPGDWNQALMELGAVVCRPEAPVCLLCPVREHCGAFRAGRVHELPPAKVRAARKRLELGCGVWLRRGKLLLARRAERGLFGGLWELPSVTLEGKATVENPESALRALLGVPLTVDSPLGKIQRTLTHRDLTLHLWKVQGAGKPVPSQPYEELAWKSPGEVADLGISTAMQRAIDLALRRMGLLPGKPVR